MNPLTSLINWAFPIIVALLLICFVCIVIYYIGEFGEWLKKKIFKEFREEELKNE